MSITRINKIILSAKEELKHIKQIDFYSSTSNNIIKDFCNFFLPFLKYNNFEIVCNFHTIQDDNERIILTPKNRDVHVMNLRLYKYSQQIYDRILHLDRKFQESLH